MLLAVWNAESFIMLNGLLKGAAVRWRCSDALRQVNVLGVRFFPGLLLFTTERCESRRVSSGQWCDNAYDMGQRSVCHICSHGRHAQCYLCQTYPAICSLSGTSQIRETE